MLIFVYGTLQRGERNHYLLERGGAKFIEPYTAYLQVTMLDVGFPVLLQARRGCGVGVTGELFEVSRRTAWDLDRLESNGRMYKRRRIQLPDGRRAWVYIGMGTYWLRGGATPGQRVEPRDGVLTWPKRGVARVA